MERQNSLFGASATLIYAGQHCELEDGHEGVTHVASLLIQDLFNGEHRHVIQWWMSWNGTDPGADYAIFSAPWCAVKQKGDLACFRIFGHPGRCELG